ncbi:CAX-interacting protein 4 [Phalaenopsis equestris]|uniref:CAX-interacting protein 4 n=1 Tax=Phalaenopsis equestris TaxID=78828 RepID=UPI0009E1E375|nr:CAX-interacting protein 4 [Phalaenopsis equestris]
MPATAGRVRMPANNRVHSSAALQTHGIWQSAIGYDPYAPTNNNEKDAKPSANRSSLGDGEDGGENAYASFQGLLALARITGTNADDTRGACKKCGRVGHLTFQCRNFLSLKQGREKDEAAADEAAALFHELKKGSGRKEEESEEEEEEEDESSDSDLDPEIEKLIAAKYGKKGKKESEKRGMSKMRSGKRSRFSDDEEEEEEEEDGRRKEKRRRKEERRYESSDDEDEKRARRRKSKKEGKRRRSHKRRPVSDDESYDESNGRHHRKRRNERTVDLSSDSDGTAAAKHHRRRREKRRDRRRAYRSSDTNGSGSDVDDMEKKSFERRSRRDRRD